MVMSTTTDSSSMGTGWDCSYPGDSGPDAAPAPHPANTLHLELTPEEARVLQEIVRNEGARLDAVASGAAKSNKTLHPHLLRKYSVSVDLHRKLVDATNAWARRAEDALDDQKFWIGRCDSLGLELKSTREKLERLVNAQLRRRKRVRK